MKNFLFYSCKKATELIEKSKEIQLDSLEKSRLVIHLSMCDACQTYQQASHILDRKLTDLHQEVKLAKELEGKKDALLKKLGIK